MASPIFPNSTKYHLDPTEVSLAYDEVPYELMNNTLLINIPWAFEMVRNMMGRWHIVVVFSIVCIQD